MTSQPGTGQLDGSWVFAVPPTWPAPPGFDPRKGHVVDPTWPAPPEGWQFWVRSGSAAQAPTAGLGATYGGAPAAAVPGAARAATYRPAASPGYRIPWARVVIGVGLLLFFGFRVVTGLSGTMSDGSPSDGVGSCWTLSSGTTYKSVACSSASASYKVVSTTADPQTCPQSSDSYLDSQRVGSASRYECLVPVH